MFAAPEGEHRRVITPPPPPRKSLSPWPADMQPPAADGTAADARSQTITELRRRSVDLAAAAVKDREARHKKDEERRRQSITGAQVGVLRQYEPHRNERRKSIAEEHRQIRDNEQRLQKAAAAARAAEAAAAAAVAEAAELSAARRRADAEAAREAEEEARVARAARARIARQQERARYRAELDGATTDRRDDAENEEDPSVLPTSPLAGTGDRRDSFGSGRRGGGRGGGGGGGGGRKAPFQRIRGAEARGGAGGRTGGGAGGAAVARPRAPPVDFLLSRRPTAQ